MIRQCNRLHPATHISSCRHCASDTKHRWYVIYIDSTPNHNVHCRKAWRLTLAAGSDLYPERLQTLTRRLTLVKHKRWSMLNTTLCHLIDRETLSQYYGIFGVGDFASMVIPLNCGMTASHFRPIAQKLFSWYGISNRTSKLFIILKVVDSEITTEWLRLRWSERFCTSNSNRIHILFVNTSSPNLFHSCVSAAI